MHVQRHTHTSTHVCHSDQHTRGTGTTRQRSLVGRGGTNKIQHTDISNLKQRFKQIELAC